MYVHIPIIYTKRRSTTMLVLYNFDFNRKMIGLLSFRFQPQNDWCVRCCREFTELSIQPSESAIELSPVPCTTCGDLVMSRPRAKNYVCAHSNNILQEKVYNNVCTV